MLINAGRFVTIDIGAAYLKTEDQDEGKRQALNCTACSSSMPDPSTSASASALEA